MRFLWIAVIAAFVSLPLFAQTYPSGKQASASSTKHRKHHHTRHKNRHKGHLPRDRYPQA